MTMQELVRLMPPDLTSASGRTLNPWPVAILAAFMLFISATAGLIALSAWRPDDLVAADYYEQEIRYQHQLDRLNRTQPLLAGIVVDFDPAQHSVRIALPSAHAAGLAEGRIQLYRPSAKALDREFPLRLDPHGFQMLDVRRLLPGLWKVRIHWSADGQEYFVERSLVIPPRSP